MSTRHLGLPVAFLICCVVAAARAPAQEQAKAPAKAAGEIKGWGTPIDPDGDCKIAGKDAALVITVPGKHHDLTYTEAYTKLNSPRVLQDVKGDFVLEVSAKKFELPKANTSSGGEFSFVSAGVLLWQDDKNFVRFDRAAEGSTGGPFLWIEHFTGGKATTQHGAPTPDENVVLKIERQGDTLKFLAKADDAKEWSLVHSAEMKLARELKVGTLAINTTQREFRANFADLKLSGKK